MLKWGSSLDGVNILLENKHQCFFWLRFLKPETVDWQIGGLFVWFEELFSTLSTEKCL